MKRTSLPVLVLATIITMVSVAACYKDDAPLSPQTGLRTHIMLTDAPFPYDSVARVDIYIVSIAASTGTDTTDNAGGAEWEMVSQPRQRYNLLDLQRGVTDTVGEAVLPRGQYRSLRMILNTDSSSITSKSGSQLPINWNFSAGLPQLYALVDGANTVSGDSARIVIDFDVGRSFWPLDNGGFQFLPVMRAVNEAATGGISGTVRGDTLAADPRPIGDVTITVYSGNPDAFEQSWSVRATGRTTSDGRFTIPYLMPGTYIVRSDAPRSSPFSAGVHSSVVVVRGATTNAVDITLPKRSAFGITMIPSSRQLAVGATDSVFVYATDSLGRSLVGAAFTWTSSSDTIVSVTPLAGSSVARIRGNRAGSATVTACYAGTCAVSFITVGSAPPTTGVATVTISPSSLNMLVGDSVAVGATLRDSLGTTLTGPAVAWRSSDSTTVRVFGFGRHAVLRALKVGSSTVTATSEGKQGSGSVVVLGNSP